MAWPGSQGPDQLPQVSAVPYIGPPDLITPLGFCDQPLSPHTGAPGVSATPPTLPVSTPVGVYTRKAYPLSQGTTCVQRMEAARTPA